MTEQDNAGPMARKISWGANPGGDEVAPPAPRVDNPWMRQAEVAPVELTGPVPGSLDAFSSTPPMASPFGGGVDPLPLFDPLPLVDAQVGGLAHDVAPALSDSAVGDLDDLFAEEGPSDDQPDGRVEVHPEVQAEVPEVHQEVHQELQVGVSFTSAVAPAEIADPSVPAPDRLDVSEPASAASPDDAAAEAGIDLLDLFALDEEVDTAPATRQPDQDESAFTAPVGPLRATTETVETGEPDEPGEPGDVSEPTATSIEQTHGDAANAATLLDDTLPASAGALEQDTLQARQPDASADTDESTAEPRLEHAGPGRIEPLSVVDEGVATTDAVPAPEDSQPAPPPVPAPVPVAADSTVDELNAEDAQDAEDVDAVPPAPRADGRATASGPSSLAARMAALEQSRQAGANVSDISSDDASQLRYQGSQHVENLVDRVLALGMSGDPRLQALINGLELTRDADLDALQRSQYQMTLTPLLPLNGIQLTSAEEAKAVFDMAYDELLGIGPLGPLWRDESVTEIMVSGPNKVTVERRGRLEVHPTRFRDQEHLERVARRLAGASVDDRAVSSTNPLVTIQLPRARVQFVWRPLAVDAPAIAIRKFGDLLDMRSLLEVNALSEPMAQFLADVVAARANVLVSGGTGSGKTTFINAVSEFIPDSERVITIEDALELRLRNTHVASLVTKEAASADDTMLFGQEQLLKASLRMRPDRIIVGEIRDSRGCSVMLEAANTGHDGTMTTLHANSPELAVQRMATLLRRAESMPDEVAKSEVSSAIQVIVQVVRKRGRRFVSHVSLVEPSHGMGQPVVHDMFLGEFPAGAETPTFRRAGHLRPDTDLALKMTDAGIDPATWE